MSNREIKDLYIDSLAQGKIKEHLAASLHLPLQQLQTKALDLAHIFKSASTTSTRPATKPHHQNPNRI